MDVCVVGSGGREHALADVLSRTADVVVTPGNAGIPGSVDTPPEQVDADLFVIGPEVPLVDGLADRLRAKGRRVFGPGADGARLEGSKAWMKQVLADAGVPTARHGSFSDVDAACGYLDTMAPPFVVKTDGLAAGKGVVVTESLTEARNAVGDYLSGQAFGDAGRTVVIEEGMVGPELSVLAVCDGTRAVALAPAQDFKRIGDGDTGPNTGGMGAYSPVPMVGADVLGDVMDRFVAPTLAHLRSLGIDYRGVLYAGPDRAARASGGRPPGRRADVLHRAHRDGRLRVRGLPELPAHGRRHLGHRRRAGDRGCLGLLRRSGRW